MVSPLLVVVCTSSVAVDDTVGRLDECLRFVTGPTVVDSIVVVSVSASLVVASVVVVVSSDDADSVVVEMIILFDFVVCVTVELSLCDTVVTVDSVVWPPPAAVVSEVDSAHTLSTATRVDLSLSIVLVVVIEECSQHGAVVELSKSNVIDCTNVCIRLHIRPTRHFSRSMHSLRHASIDSAMSRVILRNTESPTSTTERAPVNADASHESSRGMPVHEQPAHRSAAYFSSIPIG
jgi:hypothetical protein